MTDPPSSSDFDADDSEALAGPPLWVKVLAALVAAVLLIVTVLVITGGPESHGPRRHGSGEPDAVHLTSGGAGDRP